MAMPSPEHDPSAAPARPFPWRGAFWTALIVCAAGGGVYLADALVLAPRRADQRRIQELEERRRELERIAQRLRYTERRAQVVVLDCVDAGNGGPPSVKFRFVEVDRQANPIGREREFTLTGQEVYFDALVIKFEDAFIEQGEALRGKSLLLFRRVFTECVQPDDGYPLDERGLAPEVYAAKEAASGLERDLWARFWEYANRPDLARAKGVRALHGEAVSIRPKKNMVYLIELRATGELTIRPAAATP